jgi:hypothetical protein
MAFLRVNDTLSDFSRQTSGLKSNFLGKTNLFNFRKTPLKVKEILANSFAAVQADG